MDPKSTVPILVVSIVGGFISAFIVPFVFGIHATLLFLGLTAVLCLVVLYILST